MERIKYLTLKSGSTLAYVGQGLHAGPLPALFYFALSAEESLGVDPYNQPVVFLAHDALRIFSLTLPFHGKGYAATAALSFWAEELIKGHDLISACIQTIKEAFDQLLEMDILIPDKTAVAGLSRGAFIACHAASAIPEIKTILGFAPLTELIFAKEFAKMQDHALAKQLSLSHIIDSLIGRSLRFYIGNLDTRVSTRRCFEFVEALAMASEKKRVRSPPVELIIGPSIGQYGHGTSKEVFENGALWLIQNLGVAHV